MNLKGYVVRIDPNEGKTLNEGKKGSAEERGTSSVGVVFTE
jgi:hypothetical protein